MDAIAWIVIGAILYFTLIKPAIEASRPTEPPPPPRQQVAIDPPPALPDDVDEYEIVGESHYLRELEAIAGPRGTEWVHVECAADLVAEPSNKHDKNAVACYISGLKVGYLPRDDARDFSRLMKRKRVASIRVAATVRGGREGMHFGVTVAVPADTIS